MIDSLMAVQQECAYMLPDAVRSKKKQ